MKNSLLFRMVVLVTAIMCALGVRAQEAYACYTPSNMTLTFYYDNQRSTRPGTTYDLNTSFARPGWRIDDISRDVTKVVFDPSFASVRPTSTYYWFGGMLNLEAIEGMKYLNTSEVTDMNCMFAYCEILPSLDLSSFNTANVTDMYYMFSNCHGLKRLDLGSFNTAKVENMASMFSDCDHLQTIYVSDEWSIASLLLLYPSGTFTGCTSLVGGQGTAYDPAHTGADYAHIDGGPDNPGYFTETPTFILGDVNGDDNVTISDVTALIDLLLGGGTINDPAADCNGDTNVTISDVTALIDFLLGGTWDLFSNKAKIYPSCSS